MAFWNKWGRRKDEIDLAIISAIESQAKSYKQLADVISREKTATIKDPKTNPSTQLREYKSWVSSCTSIISDTISKTTYRFYRKDTEEEVTSRNHSYRTFSKPFLNPNSLMSFRFLKAWCQIQLDLCGTALIYKAKNQLGQVWELWPLDMNQFLYVLDSEGKPLETVDYLMPEDVYYIFQIGGKKFPFSMKKDLVCLYYPHPIYKFIGASPIQQQAYGVDLQTYIEIYERDFFANSARVDMVLSSDSDIEPSKADEIKQRWQEKFQGRYHEIAVLGSGLKPTPIKYTNKDFEFLNLAQWSKDMVLGAYRVPESKLGKSSSENRSNSVYTDIYFAKESIQPRLTLWDEELTREVLSTFDPRIEVRHDNPIPRDRDLETKETRVYLSGAPCLQINEVRKKIFNLGPVENGDRILIPNNFVYLDKLDEIIDNQIKASQNNFNNTDPARHDDDKPNTNPDNTDDRDLEGTEGRNFEGYLKSLWESKIVSITERMIKEDNRLEIASFGFKALIISTLKSYLSLYEKDNFNLDNLTWVNEYSKKLGYEFCSTFTFETEDVIKFLSSNSRIAKICNVALRSSINYAKFLILEKDNLSRKWVVDRNTCGHKGRLVEFKTMSKFKIGNLEVNFPGETFNLNCDCLLSSDEIDLLN